MNWLAAFTIYKYEVKRAWRTLLQSLLAPVISTALYFVVFGSAMGSRIGNIGDVSYGAFIVPGLMMMTLMGQSVSNASFGIYMPRHNGAIYEILSAPVSYKEVILGFVGGAATKSVIIALLILITASFFVDFEVQHPFMMVVFLVLTAITFSMFGFIIGLWADGFEKLQIIPLMVITPLTFLGGAFYSIDMLPGIWNKVALLNPLVYLISGFRWSFYSSSDVSPLVSFSIIILFLVLCSSLVAWLFKTGYRLKD
ncbi:ABC transporter permease [Brackiella oedipodis]|uniref:ABC transporter permease n=1 Tax=Brackiella oedipodis TaxID=124225 RepID=UPI00048B6D1E|nr:ABC transporter permease [Brackiella oedipodis]